MGTGLLLQDSYTHDGNDGATARQASDPQEESFVVEGSDMGGPKMGSRVASARQFFPPVSRVGEVDRRNAIAVL